MYYRMSFVLAGLLLATGHGLAADSADGRRTILNERSYVHAYYRIQQDYLNPELVKDPEAAMYPVARLKGGAVEFAKRTPYLQDKDWTHHVLSRSSLSTYPMPHTAPAPAAWMQPDFDDGQWMRRRAPIQIGVIRPMGAWTRAAYEHIQTAYFRAYFRIDDPAEVGDLLLDLQYRGGVRVFVNGREVTRAHLPNGELDAEALAEAYPAEAYVFDPAKVKAGSLDRYDIAGDVPIEDKRAGPDIKANEWDRYHSLHILREKKQWDRIYQLRERRLEGVRIPASHLRAGSNVLAIELRRAQIHPILLNAHYDRSWAHARLTEFCLSAAAKASGVSEANRRPEGVQVWFDDMNRRVVSCDYLEPGAPPTTWRVAGARNAAHAGQLVIGTDQPLTGLKVEVSDLRGQAQGTAIPSESVTVYGTRPQPIGAIGRLGALKGNWEAPSIPYLILSRWAEAGVWDKPIAEQNRIVEALGKQIMHYDRLTDTVQETVAADTAHPVWLSLKIPEQARPGRYAGEVRVSADGMKPVSLPIEVEVIDWRMPDPADFQTVVAIDSDYWHLPRMNDVEPGSDEHFAAIRRTYKLLSRIGGGQWVEIPVVGGRGDILIQWTRRKDGSLDFDFSKLGRYLDILVEEAGKPKVIAFTISRGSRADVTVMDEAQGKRVRVKLGPDGDTDTRDRYWGAFAGALQEFMARRGLAGAMHWGLPGDNEADPELKSLMKRYAPGVPWARASHDSMPDAYYRAVSVVYGPNYLVNPLAGDTPRTQRRLLPELLSVAGWRRDAVTVINPRTFTRVHYNEGHFNLHSYRLWPERAIIAGYRGIGIAGADGGHNDRISGVYAAVVKLYWHGRKTGLEDAMRAHGLLEGLQTTEARIFIEQALAADRVSGPLKERAIETLNELVRRNALTPRSHHGYPHALADLPQDWLTMNRQVLMAAAEIAKAAGLTVAEQRIHRPLATGQTHAISVPMVGWTSAPRQWKIQECPDWVRPASDSGKLAGVEPLRLTADLSDRKPGTKLAGDLVIVDQQSGQTVSVKLAADVRHALELEGASPHLFIPKGKQRMVERQVINYSGKPIRWRIASDAAWLDVEPTAGELPPGGRAPVQITATAGKLPGTEATAKLRLSNADGGAVNEVSIFGHVDDPQLPVPDGEPTYLTDRYDLLYEHHTLTRRGWKAEGGGPKKDGRDIITVPFTRRSNFPGNNEEIGFDISGEDFGTLVTAVRCIAGDPKKNENKGELRLRIYTDGQLRFDSGVIKPGAKEIPIVLQHMEHVRRLQFKLRVYDARNRPDYGQTRWVNPRFYPEGQ